MTIRSRLVFEEVFRQIAAIDESAGVIQEMAEVVAGLAEKTNILALNAAIEAAHAGEFGRGFAVVAEEIGKLAAASAASSSEIGSRIRGVVHLISTTAGNRNAAMDTFDTIDGQIQNVSVSVRSIVGHMDRLKVSFNEMTTEAEVFRKDSGLAKTAMGDLEWIADEVTSNIVEISIGLGEISKRVEQVTHHAGAITVSGTRLLGTVDGFTTSA